MRAMILAAGRGERMRELTRDQPKPLLEVAGRSLIEHQIERLAREGFTELVINLAYRGAMIFETLGDGTRYGLGIVYCDEGERMLGTGGGIAHALPHLGPEPFLVVNADVWTDFPYRRLRDMDVQAAHLILVDNPEHTGGGDYALRGGRISRSGARRLTYSGIAVLAPALFDHHRGGVFGLTDPLDHAAARGEVTGEHYQGCWIDVGTPERLRALRASVAARQDAGAEHAARRPGAAGSRAVPPRSPTGS